MVSGYCGGYLVLRVGTPCTRAWYLLVFPATLPVGPGEYQVRPDQASVHGQPRGGAPSVTAAGTTGDHCW